MPRDGSGAGDNAEETGHTIVHGAGEAGATSSTVDRASKAAPAPQHEHGDALEGMAASGAGSSGAHVGNTGQGGNKEPAVDQVTK